MKNERVYGVDEGKYNDEVYILAIYLNWYEKYVDVSL